MQELALSACSRKIAGAHTVDRCMQMCRGDALLVLNIVMASAPQHVTGTYLLPALQHYAHLLAPSQRARSVKAGSMKNLLEVQIFQTAPPLMPHATRV